MQYEIDLDAVVEFVASQVEMVEATAAVGQFAAAAAAAPPGEITNSDGLRALWLAAGLATHVGLAIFREPERFVMATPTPSPATPAALAA